MGSKSSAKRRAETHRKSSEALITAAAELSKQVQELSIDLPVTHVYNPLDYAWDAHREYLSRVGDGGIKTLLVGMNPGPWGMAQTGVPFGEVAAVRDWMGIHVPVNQPSPMHPKRPVEGFDCRRSEVSGRRLWGLFQQRFGAAEAFFADHFVANYCPLVFMEETGRNRTPDKLTPRERTELTAVCDQHLQQVIEILQPSHLVGVGVYAERCLSRALESLSSSDWVGDAMVSRILHPSPASPAANKDWAGKATEQLVAAGVW